MADGGIEGILAVAESDEYRLVATAEIPLVSADLLAEHNALAEKLDRKIDADSLDQDDPIIADMERLGELAGKIAESTVTFKFRSIGFGAWSELLAQHPPSREQLEQNRHLDHNAVSFPLAAMAATCVEPEMSYDDVKRLKASGAMTAASWNALWNACKEANVSGVRPKATAAGLIHQLSGQSGKRRTTTASPSPSSADE